MGQTNERANDNWLPLPIKTFNTESFSMRRLECLEPSLSRLPSVSQYRRPNWIAEKPQLPSSHLAPPEVAALLASVTIEQIATQIY